MAGADEFPPLQMSVDSPGWGGAVEIGRPFVGEGWAVALRPIAEIAVLHDGELICRARHGAPRPDVGKAFPGYPGSDHAGFSFDAVIRDRVPGPGELRFVVRTEDGTEHEHVLAVNFKPSVARPTVPPTRHEAPPPIAMAIDEALVDPRSILRVHGWAVSRAPLQRLELLINGAVVGRAHHGEKRDDIAASYGAYPNAATAGFALIRRIDLAGAKPDQILLRATDAQGVRREMQAPLKVEPIKAIRRIEDRLIRYNCDSAILTTDGRLEVRGWAVAHAGIEAIEVGLDGGRIGHATLGLERLDVGNHHPTISGAPDGGFAFEGSVGEPVQGEHVVRLLIRSKAGAEQEIRIPVTAIEPPRRVVPAVPPPATTRESSNGDIHLTVDTPVTIDGHATDPVRGMLNVSGWALARGGIDRIEVFLDENLVGTAYYGMRREDVAAIYSTWDGAITSGFGLTIPSKALQTGRHNVRVTVISKSTGIRSFAFDIEVEQAAERVISWQLRRRISQAEVDLQHAVLAALDWQPQFAVVIRMSGAKTDEQDRLRRTLHSLRDQAYGRWRAVVLVPRMAGSDKLAARLRAEDPALAARVNFLAETAKLSFETIPELDTAAGPALCTVLRAGDDLGADALLEAAVESGLNRDADFFYADERRIEPATGTVQPYFKPDWSPDLLLSTNYIGRPWFASAKLAARAALRIDGLKQHGEYDAVLRLTEQASAIRHIPKLLCERGAGPIDTDAAERSALKHAIARRRIAGSIEDGCLPGIYRLRRNVATTGLVSIIIPTCAARGLIRTTIETIRAKTRYPHYELVVLDNIPETERRWKRWLRQHADHVVTLDEKFNWSRFNNVAAAEAKGEFLLFLNDDIEILDADWLDALLEHAQRPEVGVVGPQLIYPDGKVQHAGLFLSETKGRHAFRFADADDPGPFGLARTQRNMIAVTGACFMVRREHFDAIGGFDESHSVINNDLDYCLKAWSRGQRIIFTPHTRLMHHELASRAHLKDEFDTSRFEAAWRTLLLQGDPYFSPRLALDRDDYAAEQEPAQVVHAGHPLIDRDSVRRILAVKVDHIGDFITAFPALRRLKQHFPNAELHVLAASAATSLATLEPAIDQLIEFNFYHARSALGRKQLTEEELATLQERLEPARYDVAIDLRKHLDTRVVLRYTGARFLAGFDRNGECPWLDVALEWEGDAMHVAKRTHVTDEMMRLVDALALACERDRGGSPTRTGLAAARAAAAGLPAVSALPGDLFAKRVVCLHPASGNPMRQWPAERFSELVDLLVEEDDVHIAVIGGPDEMELADQVVAKAMRRDQVFSLVGKLKLRDLPSFMRACDLYVGNNSGPKHIAAALGVPTVGVHSGVVDATEWAPLGPAAVAVRRDMSCSPCYLEKMESCTRQMACVWGLRAADVHRACQRMMALSAETPAGAVIRRTDRQSVAGE